MRNLSAWAILIAVFLVAGEGLNLFRMHIEAWLAFGHAIDAVISIAGLILAFIATAWLGGFVYYRDKKRGKLKREGWLGRPVKRPERRSVSRSHQESAMDESSPN